MSLRVDEIIAELNGESEKASPCSAPTDGGKRSNFKKKFTDLFAKFIKSKQPAKFNYYKQMPMYTDGCEDHSKVFNLSIDFDKSLPLAIVIPRLCPSLI